VRDSVKSSLKSVLPPAVLAAWRRFRFEREQAYARGRSLEAVFSEIYERNTWGGGAPDARYSSGPGSMPEVTRPYENFVLAILKRDPTLTRLVDIGCGDFQVSDRILRRATRPIGYIGCDIASNVIAYNRERHTRPGVEFRCLDVTRDPVPDGDIVTVREVFQHLSNDRIAAALANLARTYRLAIVTEVQPLGPCVPNLDIASGYRTRDGLGSGVFLDKPPFSLEIVEEISQPVADGEVLRTMLVRL